MTVIFALFMIQGLALLVIAWMYFVLSQEMVAMKIHMTKLYEGQTKLANRLTYLESKDVQR